VTARRPARRGATLVETALVLAVLVLILFGIVNGAVAVFRYQQVAHAAREGARWAAVHNTDFARENFTTAATADDVYRNGVAPQLPGTDPRNVTCAVAWSPDNKTTHMEVVNGEVVYVTNTVSVTVTYQWDAGLVFGRVSVSSTSSTPILY
jgi:Flp pilus assembly protein TadG